MRPDFEKCGGLVPSIVQDAETGRVLMLGYMNEEAFNLTETTRKVVFYSRSKQRLWRKGETSGNELDVTSLHLDCDHDAILVRANPAGPVCHTGDSTCFHDDPGPRGRFLDELEPIVRARIATPDQKSYTSGLVAQGVKRVAQKVGEEGLETALAAVDGDRNSVLEESADLLFHLIVLLQSLGLDLAQVEQVLADRHSDRKSS